MTRRLTSCLHSDILIAQRNFQFHARTHSAELPAIRYSSQDPVQISKPCVGIVVPRALGSLRHGGKLSLYPEEKRRESDGRGGFDWLECKEGLSGMGKHG